MFFFIVSIFHNFNIILLCLIPVALSACSQHAVNDSLEQEVAEDSSTLKSTSVFAPEDEFIVSLYADVGGEGLFPVHHEHHSYVAILPNGDDSFAARIQTLKQADTSIRIQALIFSGDEAGLYIAEILKQKKREGLDVRIIVDAFSNPGLQTQLMYFDLKQHGIEVQGYETMFLQWINEVPVPGLMQHAELGRMDKRFHEKLWLIDGETDHAVAIMGGLNVANEYFRVDPENPDFFWRDQDVMVKGEVIKDMVTAFEWNFKYFIDIKKSRGIFNTNLYWDKTRALLDLSGKLKLTFQTEPRLDIKVRQMSQKKINPEFHPVKVRFFQNRPRFKESYILQAYIKLIQSAQQEILIANAYFEPSKRIVSALKEAARRCVQIKLITNSTITNDLPEITMVGRESYQDLLGVNDENIVKGCTRDHSSGIHIWEWQGKRAQSPRRTEGTMHSKYAVFDNKFSLVGSYNLDSRSETLNSESVLVFENARLAATLSDLFHSNDLAYSLPISREQAKYFYNPDDPLYHLRKNIGDMFRNEL